MKLVSYNNGFIEPPTIQRFEGQWGLQASGASGKSSNEPSLLGRVVRVVVTMIPEHRGSTTMRYRRP